MRLSSVAALQSDQEQYVCCGKTTIFVKIYLGKPAIFLHMLWKVDYVRYPYGYVLVSRHICTHVAERRPYLFIWSGKTTIFVICCGKTNNCSYICIVKTTIILDMEWREDFIFYVLEHLGFSFQCNNSHLPQFGAEDFQQFFLEIPLTLNRAAIKTYVTVRHGVK